MYLTWEHRAPQIEVGIVVVAALINNMNSDLTEAEFRELIKGLARRFDGWTEMVPVVNPLHFRRGTYHIV